ncbi:DUF3967 domain-containing protein [Bacillus thuringiensis]
MDIKLIHVLREILDSKRLITASE